MSFDLSLNDIEEIPQRNTPAKGNRNRYVAKARRKKHTAMPPPVAQPPASPAKATLFRLAASAAKNVMLTADFTDWNKSPLKMVKDSAGVWHLKVQLKPGRYRYKFLIDLDTGNTPAMSRPLPFGTLQGEVDIRP